MRTKINYLIIALALVAGTAQAQNSRDALLNKPFNSDSLKGFDEPAARKAITNLSEQEQKVMLYRYKRSYITDKYNLKTGTYSAVQQPAMARAEAVTCLNEDFELSIPAPVYTANQLAGWSASRGEFDVTNPNSNACTLIGCCPNAPFQSELIAASTSGYIDPNIGFSYPVFSVFGTGQANSLAAATNTHLGTEMFGDKFLRLNNNYNDFSIEKISKTIAVTADNSLFQFAYISVFSNGNGHSCCNSSSFQVKLTNTATGSVVACPSFSIAMPTVGSPSCSDNVDTPNFISTQTQQTYTPEVNPTGFVYNHWKIHSIDLSAYIGQTVVIDLIANDCASGGHIGYAYIDAQCSSMKMKVNGNTMQFGTGNALTLGSCEPTATVTPPSYFSSYLWKGPNGYTSSLAELTTSVSGTYTLELGGQPGQCPVVKIINLNVLTITSSSPLLCNGSTAVLTAGGLNNYSWNTTETSPVISVSPTITTVYTVNGVMQNGYSCSASITQNVAPCTGIAAYGTPEKNILLYPNPNNGEFILNVKAALNNATLQLENLLGQVLFTQNISQGDNTIKTKTLAAGVYYYTVTENNIPVAKGKMKIE